MPLAFARRRPWLTALGGVAILGLVMLAVLHAPPVRARMLAWIAARLEPTGLVFHAERLDYSLARLEVRLHGLKLATSSTPAEPFLTADEVRAIFGWGALLGDIDVKVSRPCTRRVALVRTEAALANWPESQDTPRTVVRAAVRHQFRPRAHD